MAWKRELKVGVFVLIGLLVIGAVVFIVGDNSRVFARKFELTATFDDVAGLKAGAPVRMGGVDVGAVESVYFGPPGDHRLHVRFNVVKVAFDRIRDDSVVTIDNKGLLGDKMLVISQGSDARPQLANGGEVKAQPPTDLGRYLVKADELLGETKSILVNVDKLTGAVSDKTVTDDLKATLHAVRVLMEDVSRNDGFVHRLASDSKMADHLDQVFIDAAKAARGFDRVASDTHALVRQAQDGPGMLHTLLYSKDGDRIAANVGDLTSELAQSMRAVRTGKGAAHELIYGESGAEMTANLSAMSADLRKIVADVRAGKGSLGALLVDPSLYEDAKSVLGNIERNAVLRSLVRFSIKQDETKSGPAVKAPAPAASAP